MKHVNKNNIVSQLLPFIKNRNNKNAREQLANDVSAYAILDSLYCGISIQDAHFTVIYQNNTHINYFGKHLGEYCYSSYENRNCSCDYCPAKKPLKRSTTHTFKKSASIGGDMLLLEITASTIKYSSGNIIATVEVVKDVTVHHSVAAQRENIIIKLKNALNKTERPRGTLRICSSCERIRDESGYWDSVSDDISSHDDVTFTFSLCPVCTSQLYAGYSKKDG